MWYNISMDLCVAIAMPICRSPLQNGRRYTAAPECGNLVWVRLHTDNTKRRKAAPLAAGLRDHIDSNVSALTDRQHLIQVSRGDIVSDIINVRGILLHIIIERRFQQFDRCACAEI